MTDRKPLFEMDAGVFGLSFKTIETKIPQPGALWIYEIWTGADKQSGLNFLRSIASFKLPAGYYVVAETPEGTFGKDCNGMFDEKTGEPVK